MIHQRLYVLRAPTRQPRTHAAAPFDVAGWAAETTRRRATDDSSHRRLPI